MHCAPQFVHSKSHPAHRIADRQLSEKQGVIRIFAPLTRQFMHENVVKKHENVGMESILGSAVHIFGDLAAKKKKMNWQERKSWISMKTLRKKKQNWHEKCWHGSNRETMPWYKMGTEVEATIVCGAPRITFWRGNKVSTRQGTS